MREAGGVVVAPTVTASATFRVKLELNYTSNSECGIAWRGRALDRCHSSVAAVDWRVFNHTIQGSHVSVINRIRPTDNLKGRRCSPSLEKAHHTPIRQQKQS